MQAQVLGAYGGPEAFELGEVADPHAGPGEVRVKVAVAAVNPLDWKVRSGALFPMLTTEFPAVLGNELAGVVDEVGSGVSEFAVGDRVAGFVPAGGYAELAVTTPDRLAVVPPGLSLAQAATLPTAVDTAQRALALVSVRPGDTVLINGAAGSVGSALVQLLVADGVHVIGTASQVNHDYVRSLGAVPIEYGPGLLEALAAVAVNSLDAAVDTAAHGFVDQALTVLPAEQIATIVDFPAAEKGVKVAFGDPFALTAATIGGALELAARGQFSTQIDATFPLSELSAAHARSEAGHLRGKIILEIAPAEDTDTHSTGSSDADLGGPGADDGQTDVLWSPVQVGRMRLQHRLAMAPMTRSRAEADGTPGQAAAEYYAQRASLGLLITEGVQPSDDGQGYLNTPGVYRPEHVERWRTIADAVQAEGGHLVVQLMHVGRMSHPDNTPHHRTPLAPSAIAAGIDMFTSTGPQPAPEPRAMTTTDIERTIAEFRHAAASAVAAGADGVEIHGANGYLVHQFLAPNANTRTDAWGGSVSARSRFAVEVTAAVAAEIGPDRVGIRLSPGLPIGGIEETDGVPEQYLDVVTRLAELDLAYLHLVHLGDEDLLGQLRRAWPNALLLHRPGRDQNTVRQDLLSRVADVVPVGRWALANPDLVTRLRTEEPLNDADPATFYGGGAAGYTDYPTLTRA